MVGGDWRDDGARARPAADCNCNCAERFCGGMGKHLGVALRCHLAPMDDGCDDRGEESHETSPPTVTELLITLGTSTTRNFVGVSGDGRSRLKHIY